ncbi:hypothetical protein ANO11243_055620 [Dothideomycetidae sp. 11243]|nr:hypothetical protein ANO11243_055620 [fungal sp. No.11243]
MNKYAGCELVFDGEDKRRRKLSFSEIRKLSVSREGVSVNLASPEAPKVREYAKGMALSLVPPVKHARLKPRQRSGDPRFRFRGGSPGALGKARQQLALGDVQDNLTIAARSLWPLHRVPHDRSSSSISVEGLVLLDATPRHFCWNASSWSPGCVGANPQASNQFLRLVLALTSPRLACAVQNVCRSTPPLAYLGSGLLRAATAFSFVLLASLCGLV